jgi:hypothetical protein
MEDWQYALVLVILIITIWNFVRYGMDYKDGLLNSQGVRVLRDNDLDLIVSSVGLLLVGAALGAGGVYAGLARDLRDRLSYKPASTA